MSSVFYGILLFAILLRDLIAERLLNRRGPTGEGEYRAFKDQEHRSRTEEGGQEPLSCAAIFALIKLHHVQKFGADHNLLKLDEFSGPLAQIKPADYIRFNDLEMSRRRNNGHTWCPPQIEVEAHREASTRLD